MRPRVFPAEDSAIALSWLSFCAASMRPRVFPAEDAPSSRWWIWEARLQ